MSNSPTDIANQALDAAGVPFTLGDLEEGTDASRAVLRQYGQCMRTLLRAVSWDFARQQSALVMLADATGQTAGVGSQVPVPWTYEYAYPINCMRARFLPQNYLNPNASATPQTTVAQVPYVLGMPLVPAQFLVAMDTNYPIDTSTNWQDTQGASPGGRVVILTNVNQAQLVFTALMPYPSVWDSLFRAAMVAYLASEIAMPLAKDKKFGLAMRKEQMQIAKGKVGEARVANGNEGFPSTIDHLPDWQRQRTRGADSYFGPGPGGGVFGGGGFGWDGSGYSGYGWDSSTF